MSVFFGFGAAKLPDREIGPVFSEDVFHFWWFGKSDRGGDSGVIFGEADIVKVHDAAA